MVLSTKCRAVKWDSGGMVYGIGELGLFAAYLALVFVFGILVSVGSLNLEKLELKRYPRARQLVLLTLVAAVENFGYRQIKVQNRKRI